ncbi:MAG: hypothetical protein ACO4B6_10205, partial [Ilumatobacteraceae bacterium]
MTVPSGAAANVENPIALAKLEHFHESIDLGDRALRERVAEVCPSKMLRDGLEPVLVVGSAGDVRRHDFAAAQVS